MKLQRKLYKILPFLWAGLLTACATTSPSPIPPPPYNNFSLSLQVDQPVYAINEKAKVYVQSTKDCYLSLYDINPVNSITQIFPNRFASDNLIQANLTYQIPDPKDTFDLLVTGPPGTEKIWAICTIDNVSLLPDNLIDRGGDFPRIKGTRSEFNKVVTKNLAVVPRDRKAEATVTFRVVRYK
jgi:hypothetical protein